MAKYRPGEEPEKIRKSLDSFFKRIDEYYPDKVVNGLHNEHKKLGERLTSLYKSLGYSDGREMMEAYGYTYVINKRKAEFTSEELVLQKQALLKILGELVGDNPKKSLKELIRSYPEYEKEIVRLKINYADAESFGILIPKCSDPEKNSFEKEKKEVKKKIIELAEYIINNQTEEMVIKSIEDIAVYFPEKRTIIDALVADSIKYKIKMEYHMKIAGLFNNSAVKDSELEEDTEAKLDMDSIRKQLLFLLNKTDKAKDQCFVDEFGISEKKTKIYIRQYFPKGNIGADLSDFICDSQKDMLLEYVVDGLREEDTVLIKRFEQLSDKLGFDDVSLFLNTFGFADVNEYICFRKSLLNEILKKITSHEIEVSWKKHFSDKIQLRAYDYFFRGLVQDMNYDGQTISSKVLGTNDYFVQISVEKYNITDMKCTCAYAMDRHLYSPNCKHMAAVLFAFDEKNKTIKSD